MHIDDVAFTELLTLEPHGPDTYVGIAPKYPWGERLFGGQVVAQALRAAAHTVEDGRPVHSMHAFFIRPGTHTEPVRFEVDRLRDGRSFLTRRVAARQSTGAILALACSFHGPEPEEVDVETVDLPADLPPPSDLPDSGWGRMLDRRPMPSRPGWAGLWIRLRDDIGDDPVLQQCGLAFVSDAAPTGAARAAHPDSTGQADDRDLFMGASLDHVVWFHRPARVQEWHFYDVASHGLVGGRGLTVGNVMAEDGTHVATVAQEVLLRRRRPRPSDGSGQESRV